MFDIHRVKPLCRSTPYPREEDAVLREDVEKRVLRVLINSGLIALIFLVLSFLNINFSSILAVIPLRGFTLTTTMALVAIIILFFTALRVTLDLIKLIDIASGSLLRHIPGFNPDKGSSIIRALKELLVAFIIIISISIASPLISSIPGMGGWISLIISIILFAFSLILMYDAGRTIYAAFESSIQILIDRIVSRANKGENGEKK